MSSIKLSENFKKMLREIVCAYGPSGREAKAAEVIKGYLEGHADKIYTDALGNLIAYKKGKSGEKGKKVMLSAHMDQIGFVVVDIDEKGFIRIAPVGGISPIAAYARSVTFENGVTGIIYIEAKDFDAGKMNLGKMFVDIGASSKEEAEKSVSVGDMAVYTPVWNEMGDKFSCAYMDDRVCCALMLEVFLKAEPVHDIYAVFTTQEEVGIRGSKVAAYSIEPDFGLNFDVTGSGDLPGAAPLAVKLGKGAAIKVMDRSVIVPVSARNFLVECAKEAGADYQMEVLPYGGTDTASVQQSRGGVIASCISVPCRYIHTAHETVSAADIEAAIAVSLKALSKTELPCC